MKNIVVIFSMLVLMFLSALVGYAWRGRAIVPVPVIASPVVEPAAVVPPTAEPAVTVAQPVPGARPTPRATDPAVTYQGPAPLTPQQKAEEERIRKLVMHTLMYPEDANIQREIDREKSRRALGLQGSGR